MRATGGNVKKLNFMRFAKYALILGVAIFVMGLTPAHADGIFDVTGATFDNGTTVSGSFTISGGVVTGGSFTISGVTGTLATFIPAFSGCGGGECMLVFSTTGNIGDPFVTLIFAATSLSSYNGGSLCTGFSAGCPDGASIDSTGGQNLGFLTAGSITSAPEPSTYLLLGSGLVGLGLLRRKRLVTNA
jgi:hypothetical protein